MKTRKKDRKSNNQSTTKEIFAGEENFNVFPLVFLVALN